MNSLIQLKKATSGLLIAFVLACFPFSPTALAVTPAPDGGYPGANTAEGDDALFNLDTSQGFNNTAVGFDALYSNTISSGNTAIGFRALFSNTDGGANTATGDDALFSNTEGIDNTATGIDALFSNTTGGSNTATGAAALTNNTTGFENTATGLAALVLNTSGHRNTATGVNALLQNTIGGGNTATGDGALFNNTIGGGNIALGVQAGLNLTTGSNNIDIGNKGVAGEANTIRIGRGGTQTATFIAGISGATVPGGVEVIVGSNGKLGTVVSSVRFKDSIKPMDKASEAILALKPVIFRYKKELDPEGIPQFGLVAEEVEKVNPDLVARDDQGKPYSVRYEAVNAMLLNEFLKEHRKVEELEATVAKQEDLRTTVAQQQKEIQALIARLNRQESRMQKVNDQLEERNFAPQRIADNQ